MNKSKSDLQSKKIKKDSESKSKNVLTEAKKVFLAQIFCQCKKNCAKRFDVLKQRELYDAYAECTNYTIQTRLLRSLVSKESIKENLNSIIPFRKKRNNYKYFLEVENNKKVQVCLHFLSKLLGIKREKIFRAISTSEKNPNADERRGKTLKKKTDEKDISHLVDFIKKFPTFETSYKSCRSKYLHPKLNVTKMYKIYHELCEFQQRNVLSKMMFRKIFKKEFNLQFLRITNEKCKKCSENQRKKKPLVLSDITIQQNQQIENEHLSLVRCIRDDFVKCVEDAKETGKTTEVFTFGLNRATELPYLKTTDAFQKRPLWFYTFCIFDEIRETAHIYTWDESIASNGADEIGSCLIKHILKFIPKNTEKLILFSDPQSNYRNMKIAVMMMKMFDHLNNDLSIIEQRFFVEGHTGSSCDRSFLKIDNKRKSMEEIFSPEQYIDMIKQIKTTDLKFNVIEMSRKDFLSCESLMNAIKIRKTTIIGQDLNWLNIQNITYKRNELLLFHMSEYEEQKTPLTICMQKWDGPTSFENIKFKHLYADTRPITKKKYDDLMQLLKFVPDKFHAFYKSLKFASGDDIDYGLVHGSDDEEEYDE